MQFDLEALSSQLGTQVAQQTVGNIPGGQFALKATEVVAAKVSAFFPEGRKREEAFKGLKPGGIFYSLYKIFAGDKYTRGEYTLGERLLDQCTPDTKNWSYQDVPDDLVPYAKEFFTNAFGVRITSSTDLDALDFGVDKYLSLIDKQDIPRAAVERAVKLKQTYFPISTYNVRKWDLDKFLTIPYRAPIPGVTVNTLFSGKLALTGEPISVGLPVNNFSPTFKPGTTNTGTTSIVTKQDKIMYAIAAAIVLITIFFIYYKSRK